jgi:putative membrane protein
MTPSSVVIPFGKSSVRVVHLVLLAWYALFWTAMAISPRDGDWLLENALALLFVGLLVGTYSRFQFSTASYLLVTLFLTLHTVGAH